MPFLKNIASGTFVGPLADDSAEYRYLQSLRDNNGRPTWEDQPVEDAEAAGFAQAGKLAATIQAVMPASAAGADHSLVIGRAPFAGTVAKVEYYPEAAVTGANTDSRTLSAINAGQAGAGTTAIATLALIAGVNLVAEASNPLTLSGTPANLAVVSNDEIEFQSAHVGAGIADPGGLVVVTFNRE